MQFARGLGSCRGNLLLRREKRDECQEVKALLTQTKKYRKSWVNVPTQGIIFSSSSFFPVRR